jgi:hypothetical protein
MNCIDAVEGVAKAMLATFLDASIEYRMDVSEYIRNVKAVTDGVASGKNDRSGSGGRSQTRSRLPSLLLRLCLCSR